MYVYFEKYQNAISDYQESSKIDSSLDGKAKAEELEQFVAKTTSLLNKRANIKPKNLSEYAIGIPTSYETLGIQCEGYTLSNLSDLHIGPNPKKCYVGRVMMHFSAPFDVPVYTCKQLLDAHGQQNDGVQHITIQYE